MFDNCDHQIVCTQLMVWATWLMIIITIKNKHIIRACFEAMLPWVIWINYRLSVLWIWLFMTVKFLIITRYLDTSSAVLMLVLYTPVCLVATFGKIWYAFFLPKVFKLALFSVVAKSGQNKITSCVCPFLATSQIHTGNCHFWLSIHCPFFGNGALSIIEGTFWQLIDFESITIKFISQ